MFGFSLWEIAAVLIVALLVFGPKKLPELARGLGKTLRDFRKASESFRDTVETESRGEPAPAQAEPFLLAGETKTPVAPPPSEHVTSSDKA